MTLKNARRRFAEITGKIDVGYKITIRNNMTGDIAETDRYDFDLSEYWWLDGNMSCTCNRHLEWLRALPNPRSEDDPHLNNVDTMDCSVDGAFSVLRATMDDGTVIALERE